MIIHHHKNPISLCSKGGGSRDRMAKWYKKNQKYRQTEYPVERITFCTCIHFPFHAQKSSWPQVLASTSKLPQWMELSTKVSSWTGLPAQPCTLSKAHSFLPTAVCQIFCFTHSLSTLSYRIIHCVVQSPTSSPSLLCPSYSLLCFFLYLLINTTVSEVPVISLSWCALYWTI